MVKLIGVTHGVTLIDIFGSEKIHFHPSEGIINYIQSLTKNSRIGIESMPETEFDYLNELMYKATRRPFEKEMYWENLAYVITENNHELIYLEQKGPWIKIIDKQTEITMWEKRM